MGQGLYANIHAKRKRGEKMRKKGEKGAPKASDFAAAKRTAKKSLGGAIKKIGKSKSANERAKKRRNDLLRPGKGASPDNPIEVKKGGRIKKKIKRGKKSK